MTETVQKLRYWGRRKRKPTTVPNHFHPPQGLGWGSAPLPSDSSYVHETAFAHLATLTTRYDAGVYVLSPVNPFSLPSR